MKGWFGRYIAFGGIDLLIGVVPANPTTTFVVVLPIPTDFAPSKYFTLDNSRFLFSIFFETL